tara:strand:+ start:468 stop:926 length:459 start_codon:yes stop_codon:yes gene_type:complete
MKFYFIFIFLFIVNCSTNKVSNNHGSISLQSKFEKITINKSNKNDILKIIGPPSVTSEFDKNKWFYIQTKKENQSLLKLGIKKIEKNNILIVAFDNRGLLQDKKILNLDDMNDIKYVKNITEKKYKQNNAIYNILQILRQKANAPIRNRSKK